MKKRTKYFDELRIFAVINIILIHVLVAFRRKYFFNNIFGYAFFTFLDSLPRTGVPIFLMLTGILMFPKKEEKNYWDYFTKRVMRLIIAYVLISGIYFLYYGIVYHTSLNVFEFIRQTTSYRTEYHLWYMPVIITIYLFIPFLRKLVDNLTKQELKQLIILIFITSNVFTGISAISALTGYQIMDSFLLPNLIGYTNYLLLGYYLYKEDIKITKKLVGISILAIIGMTISTVLVSKTYVNSVFLDSLSLFVIFPSILVFTWFKNKKSLLKEKGTAFFKLLSNSAFYVYLIHLLILNIIMKELYPVIDKTSLRMDVLITFILWIVVTISSFVVSIIWIKLKEFIKKHEDIIHSILIQIFLYMFIFLFSFMLINVFRNPYQFIKLNYFTTLIGMIGIGGIYYLLNKYQDKIWKNKIVNILMILLYVVIQIIFVRMFMVEPSWDFGEVYKIAVEFAKSSHPTFGAAYLYMCDNNIMFSAILSIIFKLYYLLGLRSHFLDLGIAINVIAIDIGLYFTYLLLRKINKNMCKPFFVFCLFFSPLICYLPIFYTDTLSLPFIIIAVYTLYKYLFEKPKVRYIMVSGLIIGVGALIKPTTFILVVALFLLLLFRKERREKNTLYKMLLLLAIALFPLLGQKVFVNIFFDQEALKRYRFPMNHYLLIGMESNGQFTKEGYERVISVVGESEKKELLNQEIKNRVQEMKENKEFLSFYTRKISYTWADGSFDSHEKLSRSPHHEENIKYVSSTTKEDSWYWLISNSEWIIILLLMIGGIILRKYLPKEMQDFQLFLSISIFGLFLFLLIWETKSHYLVNYSPVFLGNAYIGLLAIRNYWDTKKDRREIK